MNWSYPQLFDKRISESWPSGRDIIDTEYVLDFWPLDIDVIEEPEVQRVVHDPLPYTNRKDDSIDPEEDADWLNSDSRSTVLVTRDAEDVPDNYVAFTEEDEGEFRDRVDVMTTEFRDLLMQNVGHSVMAADRASSEFEAILGGVFGIEAVVDRSVEELSSLVLDLEILGCLLSKTKHLSEYVRRATLVRAIEDGFETMKSARATKKRRDAFSALMSRNKSLVAASENPAERTGVLGKHK